MPALNEFRLADTSKTAIAALLSSIVLLLDCTFYEWQVRGEEGI